MLRIRAEQLHAIGGRRPRQATTSAAEPATAPARPPSRPGKFVLKLRPEQMEALRRERAGAFVKELTLALRRASGGVFARASLPSLRKRVAARMREAGRVGIVDRADVRQFVLYDADLGRDWRQDSAYAWIGRLLADPATTGTQKVDSIEERLCFTALRTGKAAR